MISLPAAWRSLAARRTSMAMKGGTRPRRDGRKLMAYPAREGCHWRAAFAMRTARIVIQRRPAQDVRSNAGPPARNVRQPAQRFLFERRPRDPAGKIRGSRRSEDLRPSADPG